MIFKLNTLEKYLSRNIEFKHYLDYQPSCDVMRSCADAHVPLCGGTCQLWSDYSDKLMLFPHMVNAMQSFGQST